MDFSRKRQSRVLWFVLAVGAMLAVVAPSAGGSGRTLPGKTFWHSAGTSLPAVHLGAQADLRLNKLHAFTLDRASFQRLLHAKDITAKRFVVALPNPAGGFQRFLLRRSSVMAPGLAARHPDIHTWSGRGIDDKTA